MTRYLFDNINTVEVERICAAGDAPETNVTCPTCGGCGTIPTPITATTSASTYFAEFADLLLPQIHICGRCGAELEIVRPGKYQCPNCE